MTNQTNDPVKFLQNRVTREGKSDLFGVYLTAVSAAVEAEVDYGYSDLTEVENAVADCLTQNQSEWNCLLVDTRLLPDEIVFPLIFSRNEEKVSVYFISEGTDMSCMVMIPKLIVEEFASTVTFYQELLRQVAAFAGKNPTTVKFTIGVVSTGWDDMVERGAAREIDVGF